MRLSLRQSLRQGEPHYEDFADVIAQPYSGLSRTGKGMIAEYFNPSSFAVPTGPYGDEQRNFMRGSAYVDTDFSIFKQLALTQRYNLQFCAEAHNTFDNVNLDVPVAALSSPNAGKIFGAGVPRILQFALKLVF